MTAPHEIASVLRNIGAIAVARRLARVYGCTLEEMLGSARSKCASGARHHLWMLIRHTLDWSYPDIARMFGSDHSTVIKGVRKAERELRRECA